MSFFSRVGNAISGAFDRGRNAVSDFIETEDRSQTTPVSQAVNTNQVVLIVAVAAVALTFLRK